MACNSINTYLGDSEIKVCTMNAAGTTITAITTCSIGYLPLVFADGTIKGCASCAGFDASLTANNVPTGYLGCKLPSVASATALTTLDVSGFNELITNLVCDVANSYF